MNSNSSTDQCETNRPVSGQRRSHYGHLTDQELEREFERLINQFDQESRQAITCTMQKMVAA